MSLRDGFRMAGMKAEISFLAKEKFTGELIYTPAGQDMGRKMTHVSTGENGNGDVDGGATERLLELIKIVEDWAVNPEGPMRIFFKRGFVKRIEF